MSTTFIVAGLAVISIVMTFFVMVLGALAIRYRSLYDEECEDHAKTHGQLLYVESEVKNLLRVSTEAISHALRE